MKDISKIKNLKTNNKELEEEFFKAKKDPTFKEIVDRIDLDDNELMKYTSKLKQASVELDNSKKDKNCLLNEIPGFIFTPYLVDGVLNFTYKASKEKEKELNEIDYIKNGYRFEVAKNIRNARMSDIYTNDKNRITLIKWITKFIKEYKKGVAFKGLYLSGNFGSGKSYIISAMINELVKDGYTAALVYYPEFLRILKSSFKTDFDEQFDYARKVDILLLDDIGAENLTSWSRDEILGPILQYRMDNKLATFFTSNLSLEELEVHLSEGKESVDKLKAKRIIERINYLTEEIKLVSENYRK
ncbi:MAG: primosomal protein DnaI [Bacilli bacterium]|nr:primosomal protein DnaI [Bacilli bacterium]